MKINIFFSFTSPKLEQERSIFSYAIHTSALLRVFFSIIEEEEVHRMRVKINKTLLSHRNKNSPICCNHKRRKLEKTTTNFV